MENIKQALARARNLRREDLPRTGPIGAFPSVAPLSPISVSDSVDAPVRDVELNLAHLESNRIIAHDDTDPRARAFDMLRTQVLQVMDKKSWRFLGITSPTAGCGKTVTTLNLAFSVARQSERSVLLIDLDLQRPQVASSLGIPCRDGVTRVLEGKASLRSAVVQARAGACGTLVLPAESSSSASSAWMTSRALSKMLQDIRQEYGQCIVIIDLPPMLLGDDVIAVLPQLDGILLVAAVGKTKVSEIEECKKHLVGTEVVRLVLNKVPGAAAPYYDYYSSPKV